jgi:DNA polymerase elongation subunit (family B)
MLIDSEYKNGNLICSYVNEKGNIKLKYYPWNKTTKYIITTPNDPEKCDEFVTWDGKHVKEIYSRFPNKYSVYYFIDSLPKEEQELLFNYYEPNIFFIDIETEIIEKKMESHLAESAILSISIVNKNKALVMGVDPLTKDEIKSIENDLNEKYGKAFDRSWEFKYICFKNEWELLFNFFKTYVPQMAVISGWNVINFDWVFLVNRFRNIGGDPSISSPTGLLRKSYRLDNHEEIPAHKLIVDYMDLYKKDAWNSFVQIKESNALDYAAGQILGEKFGKVGYAGDLKHLYRTDKRNFMYYNVVDSILVQLIHEKTKMIDILYGIGTLSRINAQNAMSTLAVTEGILRGKLKDKKNIILVKDDGLDDDVNDDNVSGGFVLPPVEGMATFTTCYDFSSLYPTTIRELNISADSYKGQVPIKKIDGKKLPDLSTKVSIFNGHQIQIEKDDIILLSGSVFKNEEGVVAQVMREVYSDRKKYKGMMNEEYEKLEELKKIKKLIESEII